MLESSCTVKRCPKCTYLKPLDEFGRAKDKKHGRASHCLSCRRAKYQRIKDTPEFKTMQENSRLKALYGITLEDRIRLAVKQQGRCAICQDDTKPLVVDHCHSTLVVRGLLCQRCNVGLSFMESGYLDSAIEYLSRGGGSDQTGTC